VGFELHEDALADLDDKVDLEASSEDSAHGFVLGKTVPKVQSHVSEHSLVGNAEAVDDEHGRVN